MTLLSDPELLARLVAVDSTSHLSNLPLARALADYVARPGVRSDLLPSPEGGKANLLVRAGPEEVDGGLTLCGHMMPSLTSASFWRRCVGAPDPKPSS